MCKISVIIPVYNAEKHIKNCLCSLLTQTFKGYEIILINDGSTDSSTEICQFFTQQHSNIFLYNKENGGAASARNLGLEKAMGDYVSFVDADDTVCPDFLEKLYNAAKDNNADICMCDYTKFTKSGSFPFSQPIRSGFYSKAQIEDELYKCLIMYDNLEFPPTISNCVCLFKRSLLVENKIKYPPVRLCEDSYFGSVCLYNANGFVYLKDQHLYNYQYTPNSVSHCTDRSKTESRWQSFLKLNEEYKNYFSNKPFDFGMQIKHNMLYFVLNQLSFIKVQGLTFFELKNEVSKLINNKEVKACFRGFNYPNVPFKLKIIIFLIKHKLALLYCLVCR